MTPPVNDTEWVAGMVTWVGTFKNDKGEIIGKGFGYVINSVLHNSFGLSTLHGYRGCIHYAAPWIQPGMPIKIYGFLPGPIRGIFVNDMVIQPYMTVEEMQDRRRNKIDTPFHQLVPRPAAVK